MPARSSTNSSVASPSWTWCSNSSSSCSNGARRCSSSVTSCPTRSSVRATLAPTLPPPATIDVHQAFTRRDVAGADGVREHVDRGRGRADGAQPALGVELGAGRVEQADDDAADVEALLRDLADHDVRVVAVVQTTTASARPRSRPGGAPRCPSRGRRRSRRASSRRAARGPPPSRRRRSRPTPLAQAAGRWSSRRGRSRSRSRSQTQRSGFSTSSRTPWGKATISTSHGALRST